MRSRIVRLIVALILCVADGLAQGTISTVAGSSQCCSSVDGGQATSAWIGVTGLALDKQGNIFFMDGVANKVRRVSSSGVITSIAGSGSTGYSGDGGPATSAKLAQGSGLAGVAVDAAGNVYFSDIGNSVIRKISTAGVITTVAGNGSAGYGGDGGAATNAQLQDPQGITLDSAGNLYIADDRNNRVRKVNTAGIITTIAGNGNVVFSGDGVAATSTAVPGPTGLTFDTAGNLYISENGTDIRKVDTAGIITTIAGDHKTRGFTGDGGPATAATFKSPYGMAADASGNLYVVDSQNTRVRKIDAAGTITTVAGITGNASSPIGDGGPATSAYIAAPLDIALDAAGNFYVGGGGAGGRIRKVAVTPAAFIVNPASLAFSFTTGSSNPPAQTVSVTGSQSLGFTAVASTSSGGSWLSVTPTGGSAPATLSISVNGAGLAAGVYQGAITLTPSAGASQTFSATLTVSGASAPVFTSDAVVNALGYQTKLAPGVVFVVFGSGMGPSSLASGSPNYPTNVSGTSISLTPSGGGSPVSARIVYTAAGQVAALLPSSVSPGTYAMRVSYNGIASTPQNVTVVARSFGIATVNSAGTGPVQASIGNVNGGASLTRFTTGSFASNGTNWALSPAHPGDTLVLWGTGGGADLANDAGGTSGDQTAAGNFSVSVSGRPITPLYAGASQGFPGLWQINFVLPSDASADCFASVQVSAGGELSNLVSLPIAPAGQSYCSDPQLSQQSLAQLDAGGTVTIGGLALLKGSETTTSGGTSTIGLLEEATASTGSYTAAEYAAVFSGIRIGACVVNDRTASAVTPNPAAPQGYLDMGKLSLSGPGIAAGTALTVLSSNPGPIYGSPLANGTLALGGKYSITGNGGAGVGPFTASVSLPSSFSVTNWDSLNSVDRSKPLTLSWSTTNADQIYIIGSTYLSVGKDASGNNIIHTVSFNCQVPAAPGSYTIPAAVLSYLLPVPATGAALLDIQAQNVQMLSIPLTTGGTVTYSGISGIVSVSRNIAVQ